MNLDLKTLVNVWSSDARIIFRQILVDLWMILVLGEILAKISEVLNSEVF